MLWLVPRTRLRTVHPDAGTSTCGGLISMLKRTFPARGMPWRSRSRFPNNAMTARPTPFFLRARQKKTVILVVAEGGMQTAHPLAPIRVGGGLFRRNQSSSDTPGAGSPIRCAGWPCRFRLLFRPWLCPWPATAFGHRYSSVAGRVSE